MAKKVKINCKYYQVREMVDDEITDNIYDLQTWIAEIASMDLGDRNRDLDNIKGRLEEVTRFKYGNVYAMNFMRFDDISTSYKLSEFDAAEHIDLEENEYIAKNTVCLYDADKGLIMIQTNRGSYAFKSIQTYINSFLKTENKCAIIPIKENVDMLNGTAEYMKLDLRLSNLSDIKPDKGSSFERILEGVNELEGVNAHIEISLGQEKNRALHRNNVIRLIGELINNRGCVSSAKVKLFDDQISGVYDLFDNLCHDYVDCEVDQTGGITFSYLAEKMQIKYSEGKVKARIERALL